MAIQGIAVGQRLQTHLQKSSQVVHLGLHPMLGWEEVDGSVHEPLEAGVGEGLAVQHDQQRSKEVTHTLGVAHVQVAPHIAAHNVAEFLQVSQLLEVPVCVCVCVCVRACG